jgi:hypothetical protein
MNQLYKLSGILGKTVRSFGEVDERLVLVFSDNSFIALRSGYEGAAPEEWHRPLSGPHWPHKIWQWIHAGLMEEREGRRLMEEMEVTRENEERRMELEKLAELKAKYEGSPETVGEQHAD